MAANNEKPTDKKAEEAKSGTRSVLPNIGGTTTEREASGPKDPRRPK